MVGKNGGLPRLGSGASSSSEGGGGGGSKGGTNDVAQNMVRGLQKARQRKKYVEFVGRRQEVKFIISGHPRPVREILRKLLEDDGVYSVDFSGGAEETETAGQSSSQKSESQKSKEEAEAEAEKSSGVDFHRKYGIKGRREIFLPSSRGHDLNVFIQHVIPLGGRLSEFLLSAV